MRQDDAYTHSIACNCVRQARFCSSLPRNTPILVKPLPEAPRRSRFRFFLPFQGPFWAQTSAKALIRFRAPWAGPLCGVGRQGGTCPGSLCHHRARALRHTHRRCLRAGLQCGCFGGSGVSPSLNCRADLVVWSRRRSVGTNLPGRRQCPQCPDGLAWLAASPWCLGELSL